MKGGCSPLLGVSMSQLRVTLVAGLRAATFSDKFR
jgi:hypothetical protein